MENFRQRIRLIGMVFLKRKKPQKENLLREMVCVGNHHYFHSLINVDDDFQEFFPFFCWSCGQNYFFWFFI